MRLLGHYVGRTARAAALLSAAALSPAAVASADVNPPPIRHVWVINLENTSYGQTFGAGGNFFGATVPPHPYLKDSLPSRGALLRQYYGIGHNSLDNYIAELSGQSPTPDTQGDCLSGTDFQQVGTDPHGQAIGQGCVYPANVKTFADQLDAKGMTWKGYMEDLGYTGNHPGSPGDGQPCGRGNGYQQTDLYAAKHNPYPWFHSLVDQPTCEKRVLPLDAIGRDLASISTTPNLSFISPDLCSDGHDCGLDTVDRWLQHWVPLILASPAYRQDGMLVVTFDEASSLIGISGGEDTSACCNEIPGPNTPMPGESGPGGGRVGAVILSPYVKPGTTSDHPYNHYSLLRSLEDGFGITSGGDDGHGHLGFAGSYDVSYPGPGSFGCDVYTLSGPCQTPAQPAAPNPASGSVSAATGPRPADGSTVWRNPLPGSNSLRSISCPSVSTCFAAGQTGTILATTDSGATWSPKGSGTVRDLAGISCPSTSTCFAVGEAGTIVRSADSGATWSTQASGTGRDLKAVSCVSTARCFAVGDGGAIVATADGGLSWTAQSSGADSTLRGISCPDASTCLVVGDLWVPHPGPLGTSYTDALLKTVDGGSTWTLSDRGDGSYTLHTITCPTASRCFAGGDAAQLVSSNDGGSTWSNVIGSHSTARTFGVSCASSTSCVAVGMRLAAFNPSPAGQVSSTSDGSSFNDQAAGTSDDLRGVSCPAVTACYAVGDRGTIVARIGGTVWSTQTKTATPLPPSPLWGREPSTRAPLLLGLACGTSSACFAVGDGGLIAGTTDGGAHWASKTSGTDARLYAVGCADAKNCVAAGDDGKIIGTSTGSSWTAQSSGTNETLAAAACPTASACFVVGDHGTILATMDHGATWHAQPSGTTADLNGISCSRSSSCVAVGSLGTILQTTNAGRNWSARSSGTTVYLGGVSCSGTKSCVAVGQSGTVLASADGGQTWSARSAGVGDGLDSINCSSARACIASGSSGTILSTANGGTSWVVQGTGTARDLRSVGCTATTSCVAAGDAGTILQITPRAR